MRSLFTLIESTTITILAIFLVSSSSSSSSSAATSDSLAPGQSINAGQTLVSAGRTITLGFFSPGKSNRLYLGLWQTNVSDRTVMWVANREAPVEGTNDANLSLSLDGNLSIFDGSTVVWSTNTTKLNSPIARLTDNGNFVVFNGTRNGAGGVAAWQSFQHPTDTLLPDMTIGVNFRTGVNVSLSSWRNSDDPAPGDYTLAIDARGVPQFVLYYKSKPNWRMGPWTGKYWSGITPSTTMLNNLNFSFNQTEDEVSYAFHVTSKQVFSSLVVNQSIGKVVRWLWILSPNTLVPTNKYNWPAPNEKCSTYKQCGTFSVCNGYGLMKVDCSCLEGFMPNNSSTIGGDCVRKTPLDCRNGTDGFAKITGIKLPDTTVAVADHGLGMEECKMACIKNCSCTAYASAGSDGSGCLMWLGDLFDMKTQADRPQDVYIRIGSEKIESPQIDFEKKTGNNKKVIVVVVICAVLGVLLSGCVCCFVWRKKNIRGYMKGSRGNLGGGSDTEDLDLPMLDFATVAAATNNFSDENKLGQGGFGPVYKGTMADGQEVAVKRLSNCSTQGIKEFKNEVQLIAKLQHRNLVKLISCCIRADERMLIYEYMPNKSLDYSLFDKSKDESLDWETRYKIVVGTARGILYLHQDSRLRIIHRDLKAGNVLLDAEMNPKISDFGTARIFGGNDNDFNNTVRVVGTYGYMSPEYALDGIFSTKSDVFSFGVLVLEIVSGVKNRAVFQSDPRQNLIGHTWTLWTEGNIYRLIDESVASQQTSSFKKSQVFKCIQIGLLCVQEQPDDRPSMSSVVHMLAGDGQSLPEPKQPGFVTSSAPIETNTTSSKDQGLSTTNDMSITVVEGR